VKYNRLRDETYTIVRTRDGFVVPVQAGTVFEIQEAA